MLLDAIFGDSDSHCIRFVGVIFLGSRFDHSNLIESDGPKSDRTVTVFKLIDNDD